MGRIVEEFQHELASYAKPGPERERLRLYLLGLEREQIVTIGYRESLMLHRLRQLDVPEGVRELIRHALLWAWRDEAMHALYVRGTLLRQGSLLLRARAFLEQLTGSIEGWVSSVQQHFTWREAPLSRFVAWWMSVVGMVMGRVPRAVRETLKHGAFRDFAQVNVELETTAELVWQRMAELAQRFGDDAAAFERMAKDERNHAIVFEAIAQALDADGRLTSGATEQSLTSAIGRAGEEFLPRARRTGLTGGNPIGSGGPVHVVEGQAGQDAEAALDALLDALKLPELVEARARAVGKPVSELRVAIKPTFMLAYSQRDRSTFTDPRLVTRLAVRLRELGVGDVAIVEARNLYEDFYAHRTVAEVARHFGFEWPHGRIVDAGLDQRPHVFPRGFGQPSVSATWADADLRISFGKLRSHPVELVYLATANVEGLGQRADRFFFSERQAAQDTATMMVLESFPPHLALLEGYEAAADGIAGILGCRDPKATRRLYGGTDALAVDFVAARHLGIADPRRAPLLRAAVHWFGEPGTVTVVGPDTPIVGWRSPLADQWSSLLSLMAYPAYEFASARGAIIVPEFDEAAFPPLRRTSLPVRVARSLVRRLLGLKLRS